MKFVIEEMRDQLAKCHPELVAMLNQFQAWSEDQSMPEPVIVELIRTRAQQGHLYFRIWRDEARKALADPLTPIEDHAAAEKVMNMPDPDLLALAEKKFSWHVVSAAVDIRTHQYTATQLVDVARWFRRRCPSPMWELKTETHGTGPHVHAGVRDFSWRKKMEAGNV